MFYSTSDILFNQEFSIFVLKMTCLAWCIQLPQWLGSKGKHEKDILILKLEVGQSSHFKLVYSH